MGSVRERLEHYGLAPSKARGQNFLASLATAERIVDLVEIGADDAAVEVGPGLGDLTRAVAARARRVIALEIDRGLVELLADAELPECVEVRHQDVLKADLGGISRELGAPAVLIGNLPYVIAGRFLGSLLGPRTPFRRWGFMLQSEVAERVIAEPDTPGYGPLAVWTRIWTRAEIVLELSANEFVPKPKVRSSFVVFDPLCEAPEIVDVPLLRELVRGSFRHRRKTLRAALRKRFPEIEAALESAGVDSQRRAETLDPREFIAIASELSQKRS